jgi:hypothetical protein
VQDALERRVKILSKVIEGPRDWVEKLMQKAAERKQRVDAEGSAVDRAIMLRMSIDGGKSPLLAAKSEPKKKTTKKGARRPYIWGVLAKGSVEAPPKALAVFGIIAGLAQWSKKSYAWPSEEYILLQCEQYYHLPMCRSTLGRVKAWLINNALLTTTRRHRKSKTFTGLGKDGHLKPNSTLYRLGPRAFSLMNGLGKKVLKFFNHFRLPPWEKFSGRGRHSSLLRHLTGFIQRQNIDLVAGTVSPPARL